MGDGGLSGSLLLGVAAALGATLSYNAAIIVQGKRVSAIAPEDATGLRLLRRLVRDRIWLAGFALDGLGLGLHTLALTQAPITAVQPTLAVGLLLPLAVGAHGGRRRPHARELLGVAAVLVGVAVVGVVAPDRSSAAAGVLEVALVVGSLGAVVAVTGVMTYRPRLGAARTSGAAMVCSGTAYALSAVLLKLGTNDLDEGLVLLAVAWGAAVLALDAFGLGQETQALQRRPPSQVSGFVFSLPATLPVLASPFAFGEDWSSTPGGGLLIVAALALTVAGAVALAGSPLVTAAKPVEAPRAAQ